MALKLVQKLHKLHVHCRADKLFSELKTLPMVKTSTLCATGHHNKYSTVPEWACRSLSRWM